MTARHTYRNSRGMTLIELLVSIVILGILSALIVPRFNGVTSVATDRAAISKAEGINNAMFTYKQRIAGAQTNWTGAANDAARYTLLLNAGYLPNASSTLTLYTPSGYTFTFPATLTGTVAITGPSGSITY